MNEHLFQVLLFLGGALVAFVPAYIRRRKRELKAEGKREQLEESRDLALTNEAKERGKLEQRIEKLETDLNNVAKATSIRIGNIEKKGAALETFVTGQLPRLSGESGVVSG
jgi:phage terminase Nu1 subunit (DNA packaging protein)